MSCTSLESWVLKFMKVVNAQAGVSPVQFYKPMLRLNMKKPSAFMQSCAHDFVPYVCGSTEKLWPRQLYRMPMQLSGSLSHPLPKHWLRVLQSSLACQTVK